MDTRPVAVAAWLAALARGPERELWWCDLVLLWWAQLPAAVPDIPGGTTERATFG